MKRNTGRALRTAAEICLALLAALLLMLPWSPAHTGAPPAAGPANGPDAVARIVITGTKVAHGVEPVGMNLTSLTGGTNLVSNNLIWGSGMEPAVARYLVRVERAGPGWMEWDQSLGGVHMWEQNATGYGDGAAVRIYRLVDAGGRPLSYAGGTDLSQAEDARRVVFLGETTVPAGGWVAEGSGPGAVNRVWLADTALCLAYGDHAVITVRKSKLVRSEVHPRLHEWFNPSVGILGAPEGGAAELVPHPGEIPEGFDEPGETCLKISVPAGGGRVGQYLFHGLDGGEGQWYGQLEPGASYRAEAWLRQEGLPGGAVWFQATGPYESLTQAGPWAVGGQWERFTCDFSAPASYPDPAAGHAAFGLGMAGPGTLWVDNFVVYRCDAAHGFRPFTPNRTALDELMAAMPPAGPRPAVRFYPLTYFGHSDMDHLLSNHASSAVDFIHNVQARGPEGGQILTVPQALGWALMTGDSPDTRIVPYLTLPEEYTEVEWLQLVEYLGVPYDAASDTPAAKPWACRRTRQRGTGEPWTDAFREIVVEFGNETWHAGVLAGWDGFGRPGWVHHGGREYGLFARHYFAENVAAHPWWSRYGLGRKIRFALNANYEGLPGSYGELAARQVPELDVYLGHANYVGPKWETGDTPFAAFDDHGLQETLVGAYLGMFPLIDQVAATRAQLAAAGLANYRPAAYEGGPSGYSLPGSGATPAQAAVSELYGKSLGMAVSALDAWLYASQKGYAHQEYFAFSGGTTWTSHTMPLAGGFRRHAGWLALMMRNLHAPGGAMLQTTFRSVPTYTREGVEVPLMSAYAIQGRDRLSVFVLSRKVPGAHDNADFGDGTTPVTLTLPLTRCAAVTLYALAAPDGSPAGPAASNIEAENVVITETALDPSVCDGGSLVIGPETGGVSGGMPAGTVYLYVFETRAPAVAPLVCLPLLLGGP